MGIRAPSSQLVRERRRYRIQHGKVEHGSRCPVITKGRTFRLSVRIASSETRSREERCHSSSGLL
ncbi:hypothetical protein Peur_002428 [Populus x canadensis]